MKYLIGFTAGVIVGRPVLSILDKRLSAPAHRKLLAAVNNLADRMNAQYERMAEREAQR